MKLAIKHEMDECARQMTLNEAFLEALNLSSGRTCEIEEAEDDLRHFIEKHPSFIDSIKDEYKLTVLSCWNYTVKHLEDEAVPESVTFETYTDDRRGLVNFTVPYDWAKQTLTSMGEEDSPEDIAEECDHEFADEIFQRASKDDVVLNWEIINESPVIKEIDKYRIVERYRAVTEEFDYIYNTIIEAEEELESKDIITGYGIIGEDGETPLLSKEWYNTPEEAEYHIINDLLKTTA